MCLAVPMLLVKIRDDGRGVTDLDGARYEVNLDLVEAPGVGDYLIVHAGFAIERLDEGEAQARLALFDELGAQYRGEADGPGAEGDR